MRNATACISATLLLTVLLTTGCKKEDSPEPCLYQPAGRIDVNSWPGGLSTDSTWSVSHTSIPLNVHVVADGSSEPADVKLTSVLLRLQVTATDSVLYMEDRVPNAASTTYQTTVVVGAITADLPATLRITATNSCGYSGTVVRSLLLTP